MTTEGLEEKRLDSGQIGFGADWIRGRSRVGCQKYGKGQSSIPSAVVLELFCKERYSSVAGVIRYNYVSHFGEDIRSQLATERTASTYCWPFSFGESVGVFRGEK